MACLKDVGSCVLLKVIMKHRNSGIILVSVTLDATTRLAPGRWIWESFIHLGWFRCLLVLLGIWTLGWGVFVDAHVWVGVLGYRWSWCAWWCVVWLWHGLRLYQRTLSEPVTIKCRMGVMWTRIRDWFHVGLFISFMKWEHIFMTYHIPLYKHVHSEEIHQLLSFLCGRITHEHTRYTSRDWIYQ